MSPRGYLNARLVDVAGGQQHLATPALVIDLPAFERNIALMMEHCRRHGLALRAHAKTHKSVTIARRQLAAGAIGLCCAKLGEAEALADGSIDGLLVTSPVASRQAFERVAGLHARLQDFMIVADSNACVDGYASAMAGAGTGRPLKVLLDLDIGLHRTGVRPGAEALALAQRIAATPGLSLAGLQAYAGHLMHLPDFAERRAQSLAALKQVSETRDLLAAHGIACPIVSGGGTGTFDIDAEAHVFTELQAGSYIFMDRQYREVHGHGGSALPFEHSLFVQATVISANFPGLVTTDAGLKSFATEAGPPALHSGAPNGASYFFFGDEQGGILTGAAAPAPGIGQPVLCTVPHCDPTVNLYDAYHVCDGERLVGIWPIEARGCSA